MDNQFYADVLAAGSILTGFSGTFLQFRIQREANYFRQPVLQYDEGKPEGKAQDVFIGRTRFGGAFLLIIVSTLMALTFGFILPLLAMAEMAPYFVNPTFVTVGLLSSLFPMCGYFLTELIHYQILTTRFLNDIRKHKREWQVLVVAFGGAALYWCWAIFMHGIGHR